jgi:perosamine synthetase
MMNVPVNTPLLTGNEEKYLVDCIRTGWISSEGPAIVEFEKKFSQYVGRSQGVAVSNGSAALEVAVKALGISENDEVIMPTFTIISPAAAVFKCGAKPILVDSDPLTWNMNVADIEAKITEKTKAIVVVHMYGLPVDMDPVLQLAKKYSLKVIEDAAEMHGQTYNGKMCGSFGDVSIFSFYPNKHITTGEGGMIVTDNEELAEKCKFYRNLCFIPRRRFVHEEIGWNYRLTNLQAALGLAQLETIDNTVVKKREIGKKYQDAFAGIGNIQLPLAKTSYADNIYWVFGIIIKGENAEQRLADLTNALGKKGIGTRPFFWCMHEQPVFNNKGWYTNETYPVAEEIARCGFYLPSGLGLKSEEQDYVISTFKDLI